MFADKTFLAIILISAFIHGGILLQNPNFYITPPKNKEQKIEISYLKEEQPKQPVLKTAPLKKEPFLKLSLPLGMKRNPPPFVDKNDLGKNTAAARKELNFMKPAFAKTDIIAVKKKVNLPPVDLEKINNPSYISYYQIVREKIRRAAYQNYSSLEEGEVYISFIISGNGRIQETRLVEEKSSANSYLREIALGSIKDASPFPDFPKELDYPQLSFNVIISFEVE
jgi:TonB family protein